jgi:hypothetical protein
MRKRLESKSEFILEMVALANANLEKMDGTMAVVRRIVAAGDVVFGVWQDARPCPTASA